MSSIGVVMGSKEGGRVQGGDVLNNTSPLLLLLLRGPKARETY